MKSVKSYIDTNGRLAIPAKIRKKLQINKGDEVTLKFDNSNLIISTYHANVDKARKILEKYGNLDLQNSLKQLRKNDLENE